MESGNRMINADTELSKPKLFEASTKKKMNNNTTRISQMESLCDFSVVGNSQKELESAKSTGVLNPIENINSEPAELWNANLMNKITCNSAQKTKKQKLKGGKTSQSPIIETRRSPHKARSIMMQRKPKLTLTRPKEPEFKTAQWIRSAAQTPKMQARPLNRKSAETTSVALAGTTTPLNHRSIPNLTTPKIPLLQTSIRTLPLKIRSSQELEKEQQDKASTFKARPLNKKILESKGELGLFCNKKRQVTVPQEFRFSINERIPPKTPNNTELFDKIALCLESHNKKLLIPKKTIPRPFNLQTEKRGERRESKIGVEIIPKSSPCPCANGYPVVPLKTESRHRTKLEPFCLDYLVRHEKEDTEANMRIIKAQPVLKEDPIPVPERVRRPLTEVQEFNLHGEHRAIDVTESGKKFKEKVMMEEENVLKQLKKTLKRHSRQMPTSEQPFSPQKSLKGITKSSSPSSNVCVRKDGQRNLAVATATSSAASNMR